jgi:hypothetical protein
MKIPTSIASYGSPRAALPEKAFDEAWFALLTRCVWSPSRKADAIAMMIRQYPRQPKTVSTITTG